METLTSDPTPHIERSYSNSNPVWQGLADLVVEEMAHQCSTFTIEDVRNRMETLHPTVVTHDGRAWAGVLQRARSSGLIEHSGRYRAHKGRHSTPTAIWASKVYRAS